MAKKRINFDHASDFHSSLPLLELSEETIHVAHSFKKNAHRLLDLAHAPRSLQGLGILFHTRWIRACHEVTGGQFSCALNDPKRREVNERYVALLEADGLHDMDDVRNLSHELFEVFNAEEDSTFFDAFVAMLNAQVVGAWTLFETLARDLWLVALNNRPKKLGIKVAKEKSVTFTKLQLYDFNVKHHMGDLLQDKFHFDSLNGLREAYEVPFGESPDTIAPLKDSRIKIVSAIRNVIVHRAGIADKEFTYKCIGDSRWGTVQSGEEIILDGTDASEIAAASIEAASGLVTSVDKWLRANPD